MPNEIVAGLLVSIDGNTVKLRTEMDKAKASTRAASQQMKADMMEARGAIKLAGEEIGINLNRHLTGFLAKLPGVAPLMAAAFSATAVIGLGMAVFEAGKKLYEFYEKQKNASREAIKATEDFVASRRLANLEQQVTIARMDEQIARLEHRPGDGLKVALAEARAEAFKLGEQLRRDVDDVRKLFEADLATGFTERVLGASGQTGDLEQLEAYGRAVAKIAKIEDPQKSDAQLQAFTAQKLNDLHEEITARTRLQELRTKGLSARASRGMTDAEGAEYRDLNKRFSNGIVGGAGDQQKELARLNAFHEMVQNQYDKAVGDLDQSQTEHHLKKDENAKLAADEAKEALEKMRRDAQQRFQIMENELAQQKALRTMSAADEKAFWQGQMFKGTNLGDPINGMIQNKIAPLAQAAFREQKEQLKTWIELKAEMQKDNDEFFKKSDPFSPDRAETKNRDEGDAAGMAARFNRPELIRETAAAQDELNAKEAVRSGLMRKGAEEIIAQAGAVAKLRYELDALQAKRTAALSTNPALRKPEDNPDALKNQIIEVQGKLGLASQTLTYMQQQQTFAGNMRTMFDEWIDRLTDVRAGLQQLAEQALGSVNDELVKSMTTRYQRGDWKKATQPIFTGAAKSGLQMAEGGLMKMIPGLHGIGKLGTQGNPMWVRMAAAGGLAGIGSLLSGGTTSAGAGGSAAAGGVGGFLSVLGGTAKLMGFMKNGGVMSPGGYYLTGEGGPELISVGSTSRASNASDTAKMLGGGGDTHHHWNIDARGATDPAAVELAAHRAVMKAAPGLAAATLAANKDMQRRRPSYGG